MENGNKRSARSIFTRIADRIFYYTLAYALLIMLGVVAYQVISRKMGWQNNWTEELSRWMFVWSCLVGAAYFLFKEDHLIMDLVKEIAILKRVNNIIQFPLQLLILVFTVSISYGGILYAEKYGGFISGGLRIPSRVLYYSCPVAFGLASCFILLDFVGSLVKIGKSMGRRSDS